MNPTKNVRTITLKQRVSKLTATLKPVAAFLRTLRGVIFQATVLILFTSNVWYHGGHLPGHSPSCKMHSTTVVVSSSSPDDSNR
jgi:hypothetical protein